MEEATPAVQTPLALVEHVLLVPVTFVIVPIFALANAGVTVRPQAGGWIDSPITWGVLLGLLLGKPLGVLLASWLAIKSGIARLPEGGTWRQLSGVAVLCGIGFTLSLFIGNLAFAERDKRLLAAKLGIVAASLVAGFAGAAIMLYPSSPTRPPGATSQV